MKWGLLFRSGSMHGLTPADFDYLGRLGIRTVCDFRDVHERAAEPVTWPSGQAPEIFADDYDMTRSSILSMKDAGHWDAEQTRQMMASTYPRLLTLFNGQYQRMFQQLLAHQVPLAFNCSAGKDRTGVAAALLLTALGVPRETVVQDYLLTNEYLDSGKLLKAGAVTGDWGKLPLPVQKTLMGGRAELYRSRARGPSTSIPAAPRGIFTTRCSFPRRTFSDFALCISSRPV